MLFNAIAYEDFNPNRSTSHNNVNKRFMWSEDKTSGTVDVLIDHQIQTVTQRSGRTKYCWLLESRAIIPDVFAFVEANYEQIFEHCRGIFTCDDSLVAKDTRFMYTISNAAPWVINKQIYPKTKLVSMISSDKNWNDGHRYRLSRVEQWRDKVDLYGRGLRTIENKEDGLADYMFSINIENANYDTYFTEKLTDCFACGTIPVFYGSRNVSRHFNPDGIIFMDDGFDPSSLTTDLYYSKMDAIRENFELAAKLPTAEDYIFERYFI